MKQIHLTESNKQAEAMREGDEENVKVNPNFFLHALQWDKPQFYYHKIFDISVIIIALWGQFKGELFSLPLLASAQFKKEKKVYANHPWAGL